MSDHRLRIRLTKQMKKGFRLSYNCPDCDAKGTITTPSEVSSVKVFAVLRDGHQQAESVSGSSSSAVDRG